MAHSVAITPNGLPAFLLLRILFIHSFLHFFIQQISEVPSMALGAGDTKLNLTKIPASKNLFTWLWT